MTFPASLPILGACLAVAISAQSCLSDSGALYAEAPPKDAAFVRVLAHNADTSDTVVFGGRALPLQATDAFTAVSAAALDGVPAGSLFSVVTTGEDTLTIAEPARPSASKTHLVLVNAGQSPVRLVVADAGIEVVAPVEVGTASLRAVNPVTVSLAVENTVTGATLGKFDVQLRRGQDLTFLAQETTAKLISDSFGPVLTLD